MMAWALGNMLKVNSGSVPKAFKPGVSRMHNPSFNKGCGKLIKA